MPEFTWRAVLTGLVLGALLAACNVYVGLKLGSAVGMSLIAALLGYAFWEGLGRLSKTRRPFSILENNISQTASSSGAAVASAGLIAPIPALAMLTGQTLPWHLLACWMLSVMLLGIVIAIPLRRQMIVREQLPFVGGMACAEMLRELHASGKSALSRLLVFFGALIGSGAYKLLCDMRGISIWRLPLSVGKIDARSLTFAFNPSALLFGVGGLVGIRIGGSLLVGAVLSYLILAPSLVETGVIPVTTTEVISEMPDNARRIIIEMGSGSYDPERRTLTWIGRMSVETYETLRACGHDPNYHQAIDKLHSGTAVAQPSFSAMNAWLLWPGMTLMVVASLTALVLEWPAMRAALSLSGGAVGSLLIQERESFSIRGLLISAVAILLLTVIIQMLLFGIVWWAASAAVFLSAFLAIVAARISGETGMNPIGAMGKITQIIFGATIPNNPVPNLMAANVTGGAASQCADLLHDLKCGYLIGASPKKQVWAQFCGAWVGALIGSAVYLILVPDPAALPSKEWPAPGAVVWKTVAELFAGGIRQLPPAAAEAMIFAALAGIVLTVLERRASRVWRPYILSPISLGFAFILPAHFSLSVFLGGMAAWSLGRWVKGWTGRFLVAGCAGLIVGESLMEIGLAIKKAVAPSP